MAFEFDKDNIDKDFADQVNSIKTEIKFEDIFYCPYNNSQRFSLRQDGPIWNHFFGEESDINKKKYDIWADDSKYVSLHYPTYNSYIPYQKYYHIEDFIPFYNDVLHILLKHPNYKLLKKEPFYFMYQDYYYKDRNSFEKVCKKTLHITLEVYEVKDVTKKWLDAISGQEIDEFDYSMEVGKKKNSTFAQYLQSTWNNI